MDIDFMLTVGQILGKKLQTTVTAGNSSSGYGISIEKPRTLILFTIKELLQYETPEAAAEEIIKDINE